MRRSGRAYSSLLGLEVSVRLWASLRQNSIRLGGLAWRGLAVRSESVLLVDEASMFVAPARVALFSLFTSG